MAKGGFPGFGGANMQNMIKQAQKMQKDMEKMQEELSGKVMTITVGGGAITTVINGKKEILEIKINPEIVDKDDVETLEDMIMAAVNEAIRKADETVNSEMGKITGGLGGLGGLF